jgi:MFS family permease
VTAVSDLDWRLIASAVLVVTVSTLPAFITAAAIAQAGPDLGYGPQELGLLTSIYFLTAAVSSSRVGSLVERIGWRRTMRFNAVAAAFMLIIIAAAVRNIWSLGLVLAASAAIYGAANPAANMALARHIPEDRRGLVFGLKHAGIPTASLLAGIAVPAVVLTVGWRWAYALGALIAVGVFWLIPTEPGRLFESVRSARPREMTSRWLAVLGLGSGFATLAAGILGTFHVDAAITYGFNEADAGTLLAAASLTTIVARATYGYLADRSGANGLGFMIWLAVLGALCFFVLGTTRSTWFAIVTLAAFATGWAWPGLLTYGVVRANAGRPAGSTAITQAGVFVGAGAGPALFGWLIENRSYQAAWTVTGVSLLIAAALVGVVRLHGLPRPA